MSKRLLCLSVALFSIITKTTAQQLPHNGCKKVFSYQRDGDHWIGLVMNPENKQGQTVYVVEFSIDNADSSGRITHYTEGNAEHLFDGQSIVRFDGYTNQLPMVILVKANGKDICDVNEQSSSQTQIPMPTLTLTLKIVTNTTSALLNARNTSMAKTVKQYKATISDRRDSNEKDCGMVGPSGLAYGGTAISRGHFPWMAALYIDESPDINSVDLQYKCVATLISRHTFITAWHCVQSVPAYNIRIWIGRHDMKKKSEPGATILEVSSIAIHPESDGSLVPSVDIALLYVRLGIEFSNYVYPICMWKSDTYLGPESGESAQICGWGRDESGELTQFPKMVNVHTITQETCLRQMTWAKDLITSRTICASNNLQHGPCFGDSGGSLMVERNGKMYIRGVVSVSQSKGNKCDLSSPVIYCDVAKHYDWINAYYSY